MIKPKISMKNPLQLFFAVVFFSIFLAPDGYSQSKPVIEIGGNSIWTNGYFSHNFIEDDDDRYYFLYTNGISKFYIRNEGYGTLWIELEINEDVTGIIAKMPGGGEPIIDISEFANANATYYTVGSVTAIVTYRGLDISFEQKGSMGRGKFGESHRISFVDIQPMDDPEIKKMVKEANGGETPDFATVIEILDPFIEIISVDRITHGPLKSSATRYMDKIYEEWNKPKEEETTTEEPSDEGSNGGTDEPEEETEQDSNTYGSNSSFGDANSNDGNNSTIGNANTSNNIFNTGPSQEEINKQQNSARQNNQANASWKEGNYDQAVREWEEALKTNPDNWAARSNLGKVKEAQAFNQQIYDNIGNMNLDMLDNTNLMNRLDRLSANHRSWSDFYDQVSALTTFRATNPQSAFREYNSKVSEVRQMFGTKISQVRKSSNVRTIDAIQSSTNMTELQLLGGTSVVLGILEQAELKKKKKEAIADLEYERNKVFDEYKRKIEGNLKTNLNGYLGKAMIAIDEQEESYYIAHVDYYNCLHSRLEANFSYESASWSDFDFLKANCTEVPSQSFYSNSSPTVEELVAAAQRKAQLQTDYGHLTSSYNTSNNRSTGGAGLSMATGNNNSGTSSQNTPRTFLNTANELIDLAINLDPENADYYFIKSTFLTRDNDREVFLIKATELDPTHGEALVELKWLEIKRSYDVTEVQAYITSMQTGKYKLKASARLTYLNRLTELDALINAKSWTSAVSLYTQVQRYEFYKESDIKQLKEVKQAVVMLAYEKAIANDVSGVKPYKRYDALKSFSAAYPNSSYQDDIENRIEKLKMRLSIGYVRLGITTSIMSSVTLENRGGYYTGSSIPSGIGFHTGFGIFFGAGKNPKFLHFGVEATLGIFWQSTVEIPNEDFPNSFPESYGYEYSDIDIRLKLILTKFIKPYVSYKTGFPNIGTLDSEGEIGGFTPSYELIVPGINLVVPLGGHSLSFYTEGATGIDEYEREIGVYNMGVDLNLEISKEYFGDLQSHKPPIYLFLGVHKHEYENYDFERYVTSTQFRFGLKMGYQ